MIKNTKIRTIDYSLKGQRVGITGEIFYNDSETRSLSKSCKNMEKKCIKAAVVEVKG